ncbi:Flp pilus assembly protein CpaE [Gluconacetobacter sacchari DSM 12717]|uniref:Pilus assembly protein CpaE n=2 Tax=Gluconacetobacter sacchari TaxID=92759 RepID=A0A7W4IDG9_9PROT|nr:hypothetical protein [Gluconacetobacter sacchari]MBB2160839.1 hypothetical protein [Gluconacetobacter sacchari]GBQ28773.1 Flp pilus assembly protein CpaE [Gluconacetobacter sacchari DSM 12717]
MTGGMDSAGRHDRPFLMGFVGDAATEALIREGLGTFVGPPIDLRRGSVRTATAVLRRQPTPRILIVDIGDEKQPISALRELAHVVEPDLSVLLVGSLDSADFYREVTRGLGVLEYLPRPLTREKIAREFGPVLVGQSPERDTGGRCVTVTGARGGVGASTIATNLAWLFGVAMHRHTALLDADLYRGMTALLLDVEAGTGLCQALEAPERIDVLLVERAAVPVAERLHVLAGRLDFMADVACAPGATGALLGVLRHRYNVVVADVPFVPNRFGRDLLMEVHQRVLVLEPTLASVRETLRLLALPPGPMQKQRPVLVLNRTGRPGALNRRQVEDALKSHVDLSIPDLPRQVGTAETLGEAAVATRGPFRDAMLELARQVDGVGMLDGGAGMSVAPGRGAAGGLGRRLLSRGRR